MAKRGKASARGMAVSGLGKSVLRKKPRGNGARKSR